jgi:hypothetical protein
VIKDQMGMISSTLWRNSAPRSDLIIIQAWRFYMDAEFLKNRAKILLNFTGNFISAPFSLL